MDYTWAYKAVIEEKTKGSTLNDRIRDISEDITNLLGRVVRETDLWRAVKSTERVPKANDLLYRLLLGTVRTGLDLTWMDWEGQSCPVEGEVQTLYHLFVDCVVARSVWEEMRLTF